MHQYPILASLVALVLTACSGGGTTAGEPHVPGKPYTGRMDTGRGLVFIAREEPSTIGGACDGWNRLELAKPDGSESMDDLLCWKREGNDITLQDKSGGQRQSGPAAVWYD